MWICWTSAWVHHKRGGSAGGLQEGAEPRWLLWPGSAPVPTAICLPERKRVHWLNEPLWRTWGELSSEGRLHRGKMNESGRASGGWRESRWQVKIAVSTRLLSRSEALEEKGGGGFNEKDPNQRLCARAVIKSIKRLSSSSKSLT